MIAGNMGSIWPGLRKALLTFLLTAGGCFAAIQLLAPSPASQLAGPTQLGPGVSAQVSFTGAPTGLAIGISVGVGLLVLLMGRLVTLIGRPESPLRGLKRLRRAQAGQAITEFIIVFWALIMTVTGVMQMGLMYNAKGVTLYAAYAAARSAIVWIPQEVPGEEAPNQLTMSTGLTKYGNIKNSAAIACTPISRRASHVLAGLPVIGPVINNVLTSLQAMLGTVPGVGDAAAYADRFGYAYALTNVYFVQQGPGGVGIIGSPGSTLNFPPHADITVMVSHCLHLPIPVAADIIDKLHTQPSEFAFMEGVQGSYSNVKATCTLTLETP